MLYNVLLIEYNTPHRIMKEKDLPANNGRIMGNKIAIQKNLFTIRIQDCCKKTWSQLHLCRYHRSITNYQKQEQKARLWAFNKLIGLHGIVKAYQNGCQNLYETADYFDVTELFLLEHPKNYQNKYGTCMEYDNYMITFIPTLNVEPMR